MSEENKQQGIQLIDDSGNLWRRYSYSTGATVTIEEPMGFRPQDDGHLFVDRRGVHHFVQKGWIHTSWLPRPAQGEVPAVVEEVANDVEADVED